MSVSVAAFRRDLFAVLTLAVSILMLPPAARAAMWLQPSADGSEPLGPAAARGAVVWSHGRSISSEDYLVASPPYMATLRQGGWDVFRFNRHRDDDTLSGSARALVRIVDELKERGYARVVLAGQSFGAFLSLMAARENAAVDTVLATAPAAFGNFADSYDSWRRNADAFYPLLEGVSDRTRVMLFFFHGDDFDPGGRGERAEDLLQARRVPHLVVDQPRAFTGHWVAATPEFASRFGRCILDFIAAVQAAPAACDGAAAPAPIVKRDPAGKPSLAVSTVGADGGR